MTMTYLALLLSFVKIGFTSFNGSSMIPLIQEEVLKYGWMDAAEIVDLVAIAEATPGPLGLNMATFAGMRAAGIPGAVVAGLGVLVPSFTIALLAAVFFNRFRQSHIIENILLGIRPGTIGLTLGVFLSLGKTTYLTAVGAVDFSAIAISVVCLFCLLKLKLTPQITLLISAILGAAIAGVRLLLV